MNDRPWIVAGALLALLAVSCGAFGAHALAERVSPERVDTFRLAARYQLIHALGILLVVGLSNRLDGTWANRSLRALLAGTVVFSGSLYTLVLTDTGWWGAVTPVGGVLLHVGWGLLALAAYKGPRKRSEL